MHFEGLLAREALEVVKGLLILTLTGTVFRSAMPLCGCRVGSFEPTPGQIVLFAVESPFWGEGTRALPHFTRHHVKGLQVKGQRHA